jgi:hypothetical protein
VIHPDGALIGHAAVAERADFPNRAKVLPITAVEGALPNFGGGCSLSFGRLDGHNVCARGSDFGRGGLGNHGCIAVNSRFRLGSTRNEQQNCKQKFDSHELFGWNEPRAAGYNPG